MQNDCQTSTEKKQNKLNDNTMAIYHGPWNTWLYAHFKGKISSSKLNILMMCFTDRILLYHIEIKILAPSSLSCLISTQTQSLISTPLFLEQLIQVNLLLLSF